MTYRGNGGESPEIVSKCSPVPALVLSPLPSVPALDKEPWGGLLLEAARPGLAAGLNDAPSDPLALRQRERC